MKNYIILLLTIAMETTSSTTWKLGTSRRRTHDTLVIKNTGLITAKINTKLYLPVNIFCASLVCVRVEIEKYHGISSAQCDWATNTVKLVVPAAPLQHNQPITYNINAKVRSDPKCFNRDQSHLQSDRFKKTPKGNKNNFALDYYFGSKDSAADRDVFYEEKEISEL